MAAQTSLKAARLSAELADPAAHAWSQASVHSVALAAAPLGRQPSRYIRTVWAARPYGLVRTLGVQAAHDGRSLYLRLEWASPTRGEHAGVELSNPTEGPDAFADAIAVMFPVNGEAELQSMGSEQAPVDIWRWAAGVVGGAPEAVERLSATGIGTLRAAEDQTTAAALSVRARGEGTHWQVVMSRALEPSGATGGKGLAAGASKAIGFAVWAGANAERAGIKSVCTDWCELSLED